MDIASDRQPLVALSTQNVTLVHSTSAAAATATATPVRTPGRMDHHENPAGKAFHDSKVVFDRIRQKTEFSQTSAVKFEQKVLEKEQQAQSLSMNLNAVCKDAAMLRQIVHQRQEQYSQVAPIAKQCAELHQKQKAHLSKIFETIEISETELDTKTQQVNKRNQHVVEVRHFPDELKRWLKKQASGVLQLQDTLTSTDAEVSALEMKLLEARRGSEKLELELRAKMEESQPLKTELSNIMEQVQSVRDDVTELKAEENKRQVKKQSAESSKQSLEASLTHLKQELQKLSLEQRQHQNHVDKMQEKLELTRIQCECSLALVQGQERINLEEKHKLQEQRLRTEQAKTTLEREQKQLKSMRAKCTQVETSLIQDTERLNKIKQEQQVVKESITTVEHECTRTKTVYNDLKQRIAAMELMREISLLEDQVNINAQKLANMNNSLVSDQNTVLSNLQQQIEEYESMELELDEKIKQIVTSKIPNASKAFKEKVRQEQDELQKTALAVDNDEVSIVEVQNQRIASARRECKEELAALYAQCSERLESQHRSLVEQNNALEKEIEELRQDNYERSISRSTPKVRTIQQQHVQRQSSPFTGTSKLTPLQSHGRKSRCNQPPPAPAKDTGSEMDSSRRWLASPLTASNRSTPSRRPKRFGQYSIRPSPKQRHYRSSTFRRAQKKTASPRQTHDKPNQSKVSRKAVHATVSPLQTIDIFDDQLFSW